MTIKYIHITTTILLTYMLITIKVLDHLKRFYLESKSLLLKENQVLSLKSRKKINKNIDNSESIN
jgi:hypothetical protein